MLMQSFKVQMKDITKNPQGSCITPEVVPFSKWQNVFQAVWFQIRPNFDKLRRDARVVYVTPTP
jgi:hypothetical protein